MTGPQDRAVAGGDRLRAGHADREQVIEALKAAFVQGRLDRDEFDLRVGQALASRTYADLAALTADLPAAKPPQPARSQPGEKVPRPGRWIAVATTGYAGIWAYLLFLSPNGGDNPSFPPLVGIGGIAYLICLALSLLAMADLRREKRSGGQSPRRPAPGTGGQAPRRLPSADPGGQLPPADPGRGHTAEAAPIVLPRLLPG